MKLKYNFEFMDMGGEVCAVPVGDNSEEFHGTIQLNESAAEILKAIIECDTPEAALEKVMKNNPGENKDEVGQMIANMLNQLIAEGILEA